MYQNKKLFTAKIIIILVKSFFNFLSFSKSPKFIKEKYLILFLGLVTNGR